MSVKRSRITRSSSFGDAGVLPPASASTSTKQSKEKSVESPPRILTLSSPVQGNVDVRDEEPIGEFLDKCYYCKKKIHENAEVFMYRYLRAFCTVECRDSQIAVDNEMEKSSGKSKGMQLSPTG
ncbi:hypothetical protein CEY00_Acc19549 [Actinidia chinensis var. chinensis]|uniref:FLZ-type domain-containing protein n=1 Tax=Actinidia chinensis var. chinensis TaxID=1590841 RepID=A0A2R6QE68_ACTCC|nr:hypothetical protein CEY00_Acc19549 [Actinidia chinensis var. chinensis]